MHHPRHQLDRLLVGHTLLAIYRPPALEVRCELYGAKEQRLGVSVVGPPPYGQGTLHPLPMLYYESHYLLHARVVLEVSDLLIAQ